MKNRPSHHLGVILLTWVLMPVLWLHGEQRQNVLFIAVDDLRPELACYGAKTITPHIDKLAASGLTFDHAYCNQAVCGASRVSLMTSLYPEFTKERTYHVTDWRERHAEVVTLNQHFKANGYTTVGLGKIYHGTAGSGVDPENWSEWIRVRGKGTYALPENAQSHRQQRPGQRRPRPGQRGNRQRGMSTESADVADNYYADGARADVAVAQIEKLAAAEKQFFLAVGFTKPHLPFIAPKKYWDRYERDSFSMPKNRSVPPGYPEFARNLQAGELRAYADCPKEGLPSDFPDEYNKRLLHGYFACVSYLDAQVGKVLAALQKSGAAENTIVIFWADHGWKLGDHSSWCKHTNFECDTRVPLIVRVPGKTQPGNRTKALVELIDLYPSLCDLTGLEKPGHLQGESFAHLLEDPKAKHRESAYSSYPHRAGREIGPVIGHSIRAGAFRYTEWWKAGSDEVVTAVATNLQLGDGETSNLLPEEKNVGEMLSKMLKQRVFEARKK